MDELGSGLLIQRLQKPWRTWDAAGDVRRNLDEICVLDDMHSSGFCFGDARRTFSRLAGGKKELLTATVSLEVIAEDKEKHEVSCDIITHEVYHNRFAYEKTRIETMRESLRRMHQPITAAVHVIAPPKVIQAVIGFIEKEATRPQSCLCEPTYFRGSLLGKLKESDNVGWFELRKPFMFFTDKTMFDEMAAVFGLSPASNISPMRSSKTDDRLLSAGGFQAALAHGD